MDEKIKAFSRTMRLFYGQCNWSKAQYEKQLATLRLRYFTVPHSERLYIQLHINAILREMNNAK